ncbi:efflux RND transporter permease subunit [Reichenbachiella agariperforans]|uniref:Multidrug efflux pump subunit AcrB n=1 Tax=Reichenbachiella agariperforans TaxID=156994 RepID=A0A1M6L455_REIAG|nr:efflux RND transporter permease subunit [Reichenbachiella agariperforans]MBU2913780.1 efflux RND transporter permease subunit [Reichenbachiella agariperforans]SHJ65943.1 Multidrug efflux pump subunit AcrB [Reichenbachiella agariperforans]
MQKIIDHFIKYPVAGWIIVIAFVFLGLTGLFNLKSSFFPLVESRDITVSVTYPGASPQEMEEGIVLKIEDNIRGLVGIDRFTSTSSENSASIYVEVLKGYDIDAVLADVKNAVDRIPSFPVGMEPPVVSKGIFITEVISMTLSGDNVPLTSLKSMARDVETDLKNIPGISQVDIIGYPEEEIEIALSEDKLRAYDLTFEDVARAISSTNILVTGGTIKTPTEEYLIRVSNRAYYGDELDHLIVKASDNGNLIRLRDIAIVRDRWSETPDRLFYNGKQAVRLRTDATISEDLIDVAEKTKTYITEFNATHDNVQLDIIRDSSITVLQRSQLLLENGVVGMLLVLFFLAIFLKPRLAFWVAFGLPIAFLGMFMFASFAGVTINVLSLFGMIIVIGILVDDGIVIAENIYYHHERGLSPIQAAVVGTREVFPAIISAILTTLVAFSTFFFLEGRIGEFFGEVATIVILTLSISLVEALIILPSHVAHSKALSKEQKTYAFNRYAEKGMNWFRDKAYVPFLEFFLHHKLLGFAIPIFMLALTIGSMNAGIIRTTFFPQIASDRVTISLTMPQGTHESITDSIITEIERITWEVSERFDQKQDKDAIENIIRRIGPGTSKATLYIHLLPGEERMFPSYELSTAVSEAVGEIHSAESVVYSSGGNFGGLPISISLLSDNIEELKGAKADLKEYMKENALLKDIQDNDPQGIKEIKITLKDRAYAMGFRLDDVIGQVRNGFFGYQAQRFQRRRDEIKVWVRYDEEERSSIKNLDDMRIVSSQGDRVPLSEIVNYEIARGEISINHLNGKREIRVDADFKDPKTSATEVMATIKEDMLPILKAKYPNVSPIFEGQNREANKTQTSAAQVIPIIFFSIFLIIAFTFRSFSQPLLLLLMIPFSLIGVAWGHWIHEFPINMLSFLGIIALIGIVVNDGLVLIGKMNSNLKEGMNYNDALIEAGKSRFRAIFLTSITTVAGLAPLIFETSRQAQFLIPMAIAIAYGIVMATVLTLVMLPLMLATGNDVKVYWLWLWHGKKPTQEEVERAVKELEVENGEHGHE